MIQMLNSAMEGLIAEIIEVCKQKQMEELIANLGIHNFLTAILELLKIIQVKD